MEKQNKLTEVSKLNKTLGFPHAEKIDSMTIPKKVFRVEWRPNNYRRQLKVKTKNDSTLKVLSNHFKGNCVIGKRNKVFTTKTFVDGLTLQYGRNKLVAMYPQRYIDGEKEVFIIESEDFKVIEDWILSKRKDIKDALDDCLFNFAKKFNVVSIAEKPIWSRYEDWVIDKEIRQIPEWEVIHGDHIKKVYPLGLEFTGGKGDEPTLMLLNRIKNEALKSFSPDIVNEIEELKFYMIRKDALFFLMNNINCVGDVIKYKQYVALLSDAEKDELSNFIFGKFGS